MAISVVWDSDPRWKNRWLSDGPKARYLTAERPALRPYQQQCVDAIEADWSFCRTVLAVLATGTGKTTIFCALAERSPKKTLILVNREVLLQQTVRRLQKHTGDAVGIERGAEIAFGEKYVVATIQTAARRLSRVGARREFGVVIIDESHACDSDPRYQHVIDYFETAKVACFTATPKFQKCMLVPERLSFHYDRDEATRDGWLVPLVGDRVVIEDMSLLEVQATGFDPGEISPHLLEQAAPIRDVLMDRYAGRRGVIFSQTVREAFIVNECLNSQRKGSSVFIYASTPKGEREASLVALEKNRARWFVNVGIAVEGFDWPAADLVALRSDVSSWHAYVQKVGRATRPLDGVVDGLATAEERRAAIARSAKRNAIVLELCPKGKKLEQLGHIGVTLAQAYKNRVRQVLEQRATAAGLSRPRQETLQHLALRQASSPILAVESETSYSVASFNVSRRLTTEQRSKPLAMPKDAPPRVISQRPPLVQKKPKLELAMLNPAWHAAEPSQRQVLYLEGAGVSIPIDASKAWCSWALDVLSKSPLAWTLTDDKRELISQIPLGRP